MRVADLCVPLSHLYHLSMQRGQETQRKNQQQQQPDAPEIHSVCVLRTNKHF